MLNETLYKSDVSKLDIDERAQSELLRTLWNILVTVHDLDTDIDPIQSLFCESAEISTQLTADRLQCKTNTPAPQFNHAALPNADEKES